MGHLFMDCHSSNQTYSFNRLRVLFYKLVCVRFPQELGIPFSSLWLGREVDALENISESPNIVSLEAAH